MVGTNKKLDSGIEIMLGDKLRVNNNSNVIYTVFLDESNNEIGVEDDTYKTWTHLDKFLDYNCGRIEVIGNITKRTRK
jgi:hypothetical protein